MRVLFLCHRIPFPPDKGDKIRSYNILQKLRADHEVYLAALIDSPRDLRYVNDVRNLVKSFMCVQIRRYWQFLLAAFKALQCRPLTVSHFYSFRLQQQIDALLDQIDVDAVICFSSPMAEYVFRSRHAGGKLARAVRIMDLIDVDSYKWRQYAQRSSWWKAWIYHYEAATLARYERRIADSFQHLLVVSWQEKCYFPGPSVVHLDAMSNGVDLGYFAPGHAGKIQLPPHSLVFTGVMDYWPNIEGVTWFVNDVLPLIRARIHDVRFFIVGRSPARNVQRLSAIPGVHVTGFVDDVRDYLADASVCVVPLRVARGIQNKILEAMAMSKLVVTTSQAFEGIQAEPGNDIMVADSTEQFAAMVIAAIENTARTIQQGKNARASMERAYSWQENLSVLDGYLSRHSAAG